MSDKAAVDPLSAALIVSELLRLTADFQQGAVAGTITHDDIVRMLGVLGHTLDTWQAKVDAHANP